MIAADKDCHGHGDTEKKHQAGGKNEDKDRVDGFAGGYEAALVHGCSLGD